MITGVIKLAEHCNLKCTYCYQGEHPGQRSMAPETLDRVLKELRALRTGPVALLWYGGEPTMVGLERFREALRLADAVLGKNLVSHYLQTNGTLIDADWADLLESRRFRVTVSLDGPQPLHDAQRPDLEGRGSHEEVLRSLRHLQARSVPVRVSCVVTSDTLAYADTIVDYFAELGVQEIDFPPALRLCQGRPDPLVEPLAYGEFMAAVFRRWMALGARAPRVRSLAGLLRALASRRPGFCKLEGQCARYLTFGWDGSVYPCDEFSGLPEYRLGNVHEAGLRELLRDSRVRQRWRSWTRVPEECGSCRWAAVCRGGCPFERQMAGGVDRPSLMCAGLQVLYETVEQHLAAAVGGARAHPV